MVLVLDTNVLVRVFMDDASDNTQAEAARRLLKEANRDPGDVYIPQIVQAELVWVLKFAYRLTKPKILMLLKKLCSHSIFTLQSSSIFSEAVALYEAGSADFSDYLVLLEAKKEDLKVHTFDKKFAKSGAVLVS